jgi:TIR domain-containing protein
MKVFIHWSGNHSKQLGEAIRGWLPNVLQFVKPYFSPADIDKGARWANEISQELEQSKIGIIAMTEEALTSPWIMFEAGAISKVVGEARVCPIVFGIAKTDLVGPLKMFQAIEFNKVEVRQLLKTINNAAKEAGLPERNLDAAFDKWWPDLEERAKEISSTVQPPSGPLRDDRELLEEIVENTRSLVRELQPLLPWQHLATINPEVIAAVMALQRREAKSEPEDTATVTKGKITWTGPLGSLTEKSE